MCILLQLILIFLAAFLAFYFNNLSLRRAEIRERKKELYSYINKVAGNLFYNTAKLEKGEENPEEKIYESFKQAQVWASDSVLEAFKNFLSYFESEKEKEQNIFSNKKPELLKLSENEQYKKLTIAMREDLGYNKVKF